MTSRAAGRPDRRVWWGAFGLTLAACVAWSLVVPPLTGPDEWAHTYRSAAVVRGQWTGTPTEAFGNAVVSVQVPEAISVAGADAQCWLGKPRESWDAGTFDYDLATCPRHSAGSRLVDVTTSEHRGQPFYYLVTGLPSLPFPSVAGTYLMRVAGAALCSALLATAFTSLLRLRGNRLVVLGGAVACTPAVLYFSATINNVGLEMSAALALVASGAALVRAPDPDRRLVTSTGLALVALILARGLSPGYALLTLAVLAFVAGPERRRLLARRRDVRVWGAVGLGGLAVSGVWLLWVHRRFELPPWPGTGLAHGVSELPWDLRDLVAMFGSTDVVPPWALPAAWAAVLAVVAVTAWRAGGRTEVVVGAAVALGSVAMLTSGEAFGVPDSGFWWQGRYVMAPIVTAVVVAALGPRGRPAPGHAERVRVIGPPVLGVLVALHLWAFLYVVRHYSVSYRGSINPARFLTDTLWAPPLAPAAVWVAVYAAAVAGGAVLLWRGSAVGAGEPAPAEPPAGERDVPVAMAPVPAGGA